MEGTFGRQGFANNVLTSAPGNYSRSSQLVWQSRFGKPDFVVVAGATTDLIDEVYEVQLL